MRGVSKQLEKSFKKWYQNNDQRRSDRVDTSGKSVKATVKTSKGEEVLDADIVLSAGY